VRLVVRYARPTHWLVFSRCVPRLPVSVSDADWQQRIHVHDSLEDDGTRLDCSRLVVVREREQSEEEKVGNVDDDLEKMEVWYGGALSAVYVTRGIKGREKEEEEEEEKKQLVVLVVALLLRPL